MLPYEKLPRNINRFLTPVCRGTRLAINSVLFTMECRFQKPNGTEKTSSSNLRLSLFLIVVVVVVVVTGDVGGNMGLFLGCSLLTLFEFIELFWNFLRSRKSKDDESVEGRENQEQNEARRS